MLRTWAVRLHRWFGLGAAAFLFIAGLTGAVISWDHELDAALNPRLYVADTRGPALPAEQLVAAVEAADPRVVVSYHPLASKPGETFTVFVQPRVDPATGQPFAVPYNQVALDPATGRIQGRRQWGEASLSREHLLPFLYKLHYSLHLPAVGGYELGILAMGGLAMAWVLDSLIALWISFPRARQWRRSLQFRWRDGGHKLVFDLHRSGGVWLFAVVLMLAVTSVAMNLQQPVMRTLVGWFSPLSPGPYDGRAALPPAQLPPTPAVSRAQALATVQAEAARRGLTTPPGGVLYSAEFGLWGVGLFEPGHDHGDGGLGNAWFYVDSRSGALVSAQVPGQGSAGDVFLQAMFPLHSGRILGLPGRVLISLMGLVIAGFSVTGVLIWARKRRARQLSLRRRDALGMAAPDPA